ncbi:hypothetical protein KUA11_08350 [Acetobacter estunensis]|nr:hypothetical protein [Acetobacter estunensis]
MLMRLPRLSFLVLSLAAVSALPGCSSDTTAVTSFPPYQYDYLSQLQLNVATMRVVNDATPGAVPGDEATDAPIPPAQALTQMAQDRLIAAGQSGSAVFTIDRASILHDAGGTLSGQMDTHLDITSATGQKVGVVEAHVKRDMKPDLSKGDADSRANLYELTRQMMQDMNVELEYQIRNNLKDWLVDAGGRPTQDAIQSQSLDGTTPAKPQAAVPPADTAAVPAADAAPTSPSSADTGTKTTAPASTAAAPSTTSSTPATNDDEPDAIFPGGAPSSDTSSDTNATSTQKRSPATGYLKLPGTSN